MKSFLIAVVIVYGLVVMGMYVYQRNLMYFPAGVHPPIETLGIEQPIIVKPDITTSISCAERIESGWYWPAKIENAPVIVFFHGNGQAYQFWMNKLNIFKSEGYGAMFVEYPGYGGHHGWPTERCIYRDSLRSIKWLQTEQDIPYENMIFYGESLGTGVAIEMAQHYSQIKALILESAYSSTVDVAKSKYRFLPVSLLMKDRYESIKKVEGLNMPKLFIHGARDQIIPMRFAKKLFEAIPEPKSFITIEASGHNTLFDYDAGLHILKFLSKIAPLKEKPTSPIGAQQRN